MMRLDYLSMTSLASGVLFLLGYNLEPFDRRQEYQLPISKAFRVQPVRCDSRQREILKTIYRFYNCFSPRYWVLLCASGY
jgi:hypothetical protein